MGYKQMPGKEQDISHRRLRRTGEPKSADAATEPGTSASAESTGEPGSSIRRPRVARRVDPSSDPGSDPGAAKKSGSKAQAAKTGALKNRAVETSTAETGPIESGSAVPRRKNVTAKGADASVPPIGDASRIQYLVKLAGDFHAVLEACAANPAVEAVHRVRTGSRRVQALVEILLRDAGRGPTVLAKPADRWLRQMKRTRRAAGLVRDLDVHRKLLEKSLGGSRRQKAAAAETAEGASETKVAEADMRDATLENAPSGKARTQDAKLESAKMKSPGQIPSADSGILAEGDPLRVQALRLEDWLREKRDERAEELRKEIKRRRAKLAERQSEFFVALGQRRSRVARPTAAAALALHSFVRVVDEFPSLDAANLHDFRKETKKARYVAESDTEGEEARKIAKALKRVQDAIGDWHDWQCLTEEADAALGEEETEVRAWLRVRADRTLRRALAITEEMRGQLLGEWLAMGGSRRLRVARKPPRSASRVSSVPAMNS